MMTVDHGKYNLSVKRRCVIDSHSYIFRKAIKIPVMVIKKVDAEKLFKIINLRHPAVILDESKAEASLGHPFAQSSEEL